MTDGDSRRPIPLVLRSKRPIYHSSDVRLLALVDDYEDKKAGDLIFTPDQRVSLLFREFRNQCYSHLGYTLLAVLAKAPFQGNVENWLYKRNSTLGDLEHKSGTDSWSVHGDVNSEDSENLTGLNGEGSGNSRGNEDRPEEAPMMIAIRQPLIESLNLVRERIEQRALQVGDAGACGEIEKMKLLVRLGKLLFSVQHRPGESLSRIPSFSAQVLENHMNKRARFKVPIHRTIETHVPDSIYSKLEDMLMRDAGDSCQAAALNTSSEKYNIQVIDTEAHIRYKVVCTYLAEERQFYVKKVKKLPLRYAVIDIARPEKDVDARLILFTETHLNTLDDELDAAIKRILEFSQIDSWTPGGLHIPAHMTEGYECSAPGYGSCGCDGMGRAFGESSGQSDRSRRFQVCAVRHVTVRKALVGGRVWKFARVDGIEYKQGGGRRTNEIEFCPVAWQQELKCGMGGPGSSKEQQPPSWSTGDIMAECPVLLDWMSQNLP